ncbi:hypothetical protein Nepgr_019153 [Nepenthes gracilis]|uniref:Dof zinc finger protein n=1 Tax=Nepenthes gracilis TaxID=150966 RepID=A0AAD3SVB3_NEPGR|nr:hypothetical protein Nepgr_019153 [Nepenthes gracilis]
MDAQDQWPQLQQVNLSTAMEETAPNTNSSMAAAMLERRTRSQKDQNLSCPRCNSTNTKFCYYNNYSLTQPRYFCKACRRYWTQGGSLRNVPVGGGSRKNKRSIPSSSSTTNRTSSSISTATISTTPTTTSSAAAATKLVIPDLNPPNTFSRFFIDHRQTPSEIHHQGRDLNLEYPTTNDYHGIFQPTELPKIEINQGNSRPNNNTSAPISSPTASPLSALELLRTGIASRGLNSYIPTAIPDSNSLYQSGFRLQDFKPNSSFLADGIGANGARILFPFGEMKQLPNTTTTTDVDQHKASNEGSAGYWNGMLGGGTW